MPFFRRRRRQQQQQQQQNIKKNYGNNANNVQWVLLCWHTQDIDREEQCVAPSSQLFWLEILWKNNSIQSFSIDKAPHQPYQKAFYGKTATYTYFDQFWKGERVPLVLAVEQIINFHPRNE